MRRVAIAAAILAAGVRVGAADTATNETLSLEQFVERAVRNDTEFTEILIDQLTLRYQRDLALPPRDLVLDVREELELSIDDGAESNTAISLGRLFPTTGTEVSASYLLLPGSGGRSDFSSFTASVAQPIARNAFGHSTRLLDRIVGLEVDVARHQIIEAYEDYMALVMGLYLDWYEAHRNVEVARSALEENEKLLESMEARRRSKIALPIDVNKTSLQVLEKREQLVELEERLESRRNLVERVIRHEGRGGLVPEVPEMTRPPERPFDDIFDDLERTGRTLEILRLLETKSSLQVDRDADDLLPSVDLLLTFRREGQEAEIANAENEVLAGFGVTWPFSDQVEEAELGVSKVLLEKAQIATKNVRIRLETDLRNLLLEIERERRLAELADEKTALAEAILAAEAENYSYAKVTLNDYIQAVNVLDANRFAQIRRHVLWRKLMLEWLRLTDELVSTADVRERSGDLLRR